MTRSYLVFYWPVPEEANLSTQTHSPLTWVIRLPQTTHTHTTSLFKLLFSSLDCGSHANFYNIWKIFLSAAKIRQFSTTRRFAFLSFSPFQTFSIQNCKPPIFRSKVASPGCCQLCGCAYMNSSFFSFLSRWSQHQTGPVDLLILNLIPDAKFVCLSQSEHCNVLLMLKATNQWSVSLYFLDQVFFGLILSFFGQRFASKLPKRETNLKLTSPAEKCFSMFEAVLEATWRISMS